MKVGIYLTNQQVLSRDMVSALQEQYAMVHLARDCGWDSVFIGHHYLNEGDNQQLQAVPFLARLQAEAGEMTLGFGVLLLPLHNPVYLAETIASLDVICRGNFVFGVGLGYRDMEFDAFRVPKGQRLKRFMECLTLLKRLWTEDSVTHESEVCKLDRVHLNLRPVQKPYPPLWLAANGDAAVQRAARVADTWFINPQASTETVTRQLALFHAERKRAGLPPPGELPCFKEIFCAPTRAQALEQAGPYLAAKYQAYAQWGLGQANPGVQLGDKFEALAKERFILGSPEECYRQLEPYWKLGVNHLVLRTQWTGLPISAALASMRLISQELLPALHAVKPGGEATPGTQAKPGVKIKTVAKAKASAKAKPSVKAKPGAKAKPRSKA
ncbi:MAG TPA: LLM class flavin-dependent oxidoreductase [bacterium]|nr:LLM class flavin-dependent oxidoreductase [bacterium]